MGAHSGGSLHSSMSGSLTLTSYVPDRRQRLSYLSWPLAVISVLLVFGYSFSTIANWIAAPFYGLSAEQLEARLTGATPPDTGIFRYHERCAANHEREWQNLPGICRAQLYC
ncbi:EI24 domain-containing protein [Escherichia coli]